jgi:hypothetical protein
LNGLHEIKILRIGIIRQSIRLLSLLNKSNKDFITTYRISQKNWLSYLLKINTPSMKKIVLAFFLFSTFLSPAKAWWDAGHLVTALIAYMNLNDKAKARVDELTTVLHRDYDHLNHFITLSAWPDDIKAEGIYVYSTWHYTTIPYNPDGVAQPPTSDINVVWAINQSIQLLSDQRPRPVEKARSLAFLTHFLGDIHQPLHTTSVFDDELPGGNQGGNKFTLEGKWSNLHKLWDDGCGYLSAYNNINPYGQPKDGLTKAEFQRLTTLAQQLMEEFPEDECAINTHFDADFWALESHKLAVKHGYRGTNSIDEKGRRQSLQPGDQPSETYLANGQEIVKERLVLGGYRLAALLNQIFGEE